LPTSLNLLFVILSFDYDRNGHSKGSPFFIEKFQNLAPNWYQTKNTYTLDLSEIRPHLTTSKEGLISITYIWKQHGFNHGLVDRWVLAIIIQFF